MLDHLRGHGRFGLYAGLLSVLALLCGIAVWSVARTGAFLTDEGDWQYLGGDYRIGTIDYVVEINDQILLGMEPGSTVATNYKLAVPLRGGVRIFDPTLEGTAVEAAELRTAEFNEGVTLMRVRVINRSDSMVEVHAVFSPMDETHAALRSLPLPADLDREDAQRLDYRAFVLDTLGVQDPAVFTAETERTSLEDPATGLNAAYAAYLDACTDPLTHRPTYALEAGIIPGAAGAMEGDENTVTVDGRTYYYKDVFLILWSEYGAYAADGTYQSEYDQPGADAAVRQGRFYAAFTVGQLD